MLAHISLALVLQITETQSQSAVMHSKNSLEFLIGTRQRFSNGDNSVSKTLRHFGFHNQKRPLAFSGERSEIRVLPCTEQSFPQDPVKVENLGHEEHREH